MARKKLGMSGYSFEPIDYEQEYNKWQENPPQVPNIAQGIENFALGAGRRPFRLMASGLNNLADLGAKMQGIEQEYQLSGDEIGKAFGLSDENIVTGTNEQAQRFGEGAFDMGLSLAVGGAVNNAVPMGQMGKARSMWEAAAREGLKGLPYSFARQGIRLADTGNVNPQELAQDTLIDTGIGALTYGGGKILNSMRNAGEGGFINIGSKFDSIEESTKGAKKYKSADEFIAAHGEPVYHGTPHQFEEFSLDRAGSTTDTGMWGTGHYFTNKRVEAQTYADRLLERGIKGEIKDSYLDLKNPYIIRDSADIPTPEQIGIDPDMSIDEMKNAAKNYSDKFRDYLQKKGYDGVIRTWGDGSEEYVVFNSKQIKTKEQLQKIWQQANKSDIAEQVSKTTNKYRTTINIQDKDDLDYLRRIFGEDTINDIKAGKMTNWRGENYSDVARVNIISETPQTIEQKLSGKIKDIKLKSDTFYHGTSSEGAEGIMSSGFKTGATLPEDAFRGGGYGKMQNSVSLAETPKEASIFSTLRPGGQIVETKLKPDAKVVSIEGVEDAIDLEDYISYLKKKKIDAVYIGGGEKELVVINPKSIKATKIVKNLKGNK